MEQKKIGVEIMQKFKGSFPKFKSDCRSSRYFCHAKIIGGLVFFFYN